MQDTGVEGELVGDLMQGGADELECGELIGGGMHKDMAAVPSHGAQSSDLGPECGRQPPPPPVRRGRMRRMAGTA